MTTSDAISGFRRDLAFGTIVTGTPEMPPALTYAAPLRRAACRQAAE